MNEEQLYDIAIPLLGAAIAGTGTYRLLSSLDGSLKDNTTQKLMLSTLAAGMGGRVAHSVKDRIKNIAGVGRSGIISTGTPVILNSSNKASASKTPTPGAKGEDPLKAYKALVQRATQHPDYVPGARLM